MCEGSESKPKAGKSSSLRRCMTAPLRALRRARDMYVNSLGDCAGAGGGGGRGAPMSGVPAGMVAMMPRARSSNAFGQSNRFGAEENDFKELVRANSKQDAAAVRPAVPRSQSMAVGIGKIDEDNSCHFDGDVKLGFPRSRSLAVMPAGRTAGIKA